MDALFNHIFLPKTHNDKEDSKLILFWYKKGIAKDHAVKSTGVADRPNHFVTLLPLPGRHRFTWD